jgi:hypothetical protein
VAPPLLEPLPQPPFGVIREPEDDELDDQLAAG